MATRPAGSQPQADGHAAPDAEARLRARARLDRLWRRGREFLGTELAIMGGAMTWVSERNLVAAISNGGGFGVIACGAMNPEQLDAEIAGTLAAKGINIQVISTSEIKVSVLVAEEYTELAVRALHTAYGLDGD